MDTRILRARVLFVFGVVGFLVGTVDPLEGSPLILAGVAALALATYLRRSPARTLLAWALVQVAVGVAVLFVLSAYGGFGGASGRSVWWGLLLLPYASGWLLALVGLVREAAGRFSAARTS